MLRPKTISATELAIKLSTGECKHLTFEFVKYELFQSSVLDFNTLLFEDRMNSRPQVCFFQNGVLLHNKNLNPD